MNNIIKALEKSVINNLSSNMIGPLKIIDKTEQTVTFNDNQLPLGTLLYIVNARKERTLFGYIYKNQGTNQLALLLNKNIDTSEIDSSIYASREKMEFSFIPTMVGCLIDPFGKIIKRLTKKNTINISPKIISYKGHSPNPCERREINNILYTKIAAIDIFNTIGLGQKIAILAEPGVGKTTLITKLSENSQTNINIITLVGERGREINEFIKTVPENILEKTIIIMSTSDDTAATRVTSVEAAISLAEYFRTSGFDVLLEVDSFTRFLRAFRELSLELGELPISQGYSASVYPTIAKLLERLGNDQFGTITTFFTLLISAEIIEEPLVKEIISLSDGHIYLSKLIANNGIYPAIDIRNSLSRLQTKLLDKELLEEVSKLRQNILEIEKIKSQQKLGIKTNESQNNLLDKESSLLRLLSSKTHNFESMRDLLVIKQSD